MVKTAQKVILELIASLMCLLIVGASSCQQLKSLQASPSPKQGTDPKKTVDYLIGLAQQEYPQELTSLGQANRGGRLSCFIYEESGYSPGGKTDIESQELKATIPNLVALLSNEDPNIRISATKVLRVLNSKAVPALASPALVKLLEAKEPDVRVAAAETLACIGPDAAAIAVTPLINRLQDENITVRSRVVATLGAIGPAANAAIIPLTKRLQDEDELVRTWASSAIEEIQRVGTPSLEQITSREGLSTPEAVEKTPVKILINRLEDKDQNVRLKAIKVLGSMGSTAKLATSSLIKALKDKNEKWEIRLNAFAALGKIGDAAQADLDQLSKPFIIEALQENLKRDEANSREKQDSYEENFNVGLPPHKRRAIFLASMKTGASPSLNKALRDILSNRDNAYKVRYSAAFILGSLEFHNSHFPVSSSETISLLKSTANDPSEDFDIRWMSAFSLARMGQDMSQFFTANHLMNPVQIHCPSFLDLFDPYTGWCENRRGGGGGSGGWWDTFTGLFRS